MHFNCRIVVFRLTLLPPSDGQNKLASVLFKTATTVFYIVGVCKISLGGRIATLQSQPGSMARSLPASLLLGGAHAAASAGLPGTGRRLCRALGPLACQLLAPKHVPTT